MYKFFVIVNNKYRGIGDSAFLAINAALGQSLFNLFMDEQPQRGYMWTNYTPRTLKSKTPPITKAPVKSLNLCYETASISHNGIQLVQVFRSQSIQCIQQLKQSYDQRARITKFASNAKSGTNAVPVKYTRVLPLSARKPPQPKRVPVKVQPVKGTSNQSSGSKRTPPR